MGAFTLGYLFRGGAGYRYRLVKAQRPGQRQPEPGTDCGEPLVVRSGEIGGGGEEGDGRLVRSRGLRQVRGLDRSANSGCRAWQGPAECVLGDDLGRLRAGGNPRPGRLKGVRQTPVKPGLPGGAEGVIDRLPGQGVPELVALGGLAGPDQSRGEQLVKRGQRGAVIEVRGRGGDREKERPGKPGCGLRKQVRPGRQPRAAAGKDLPHSFGNRHQREAGLQGSGAALIQRALLHEVADHFLGEERVTARMRRNGRDQRR